MSSGRNSPSRMIPSMISCVRWDNSFLCWTVRMMSWLPAFEVAMIMVLRAFTLLPRPSVKTPSSRICKNKSWTERLAFSNSSSSSTQYGCSRSMSGSTPLWLASPSNWKSASPSLNSDISRRCNLCSPPKKIFASAFAVSVFPTPVGPRKRNEPIGLSVDWMPARARRIVLAIASSARSWPMTCRWSLSSRCSSKSRSSSLIGPAGTPVFSLTIS